MQKIEQLNSYIYTVISYKYAFNYNLGGKNFIFIDDKKLISLLVSWYRIKNVSFITIFIRTFGCPIWLSCHILNCSENVEAHLLFMSLLILCTCF